jgi:four helix bundle suffix protein
MSEIILPHGGYEKLLSYQKSEIVFDATVTFCRRFLKYGDRTVDQMVQAARSGKQNIAEGSMASGTSKETELKLTNVARASLEELLIDYKDYLRVNNYALWDKNDKQAVFVRKLASQKNCSYQQFREFFETRGGEVVANIAICLIYQAKYLLEKQIAQLEADFLNHGGIRERMSAARREARRKESGTHRTNGRHGTGEGK